MTPFACSHSSPFLPPSPTRPSPPPTTTAATPLPSSKPTRRDASRRMLLATTALSTLLRPLPARSDDDFLEDEQRLVRIFQDTTGSVVCIKNLELVGDGRGGDGDEEENVKVEGTGSGFVWDSKGHIVTNYHVIANFAADRTGRQLCKVLLEDSSGKTFAENASLTGFDSENDVAVLKVNVNPERLKPALIGTSDNLHVGQNCYAIGNPYGYEHTLTTGVVSGLGREIPSPNGQSIRGAIQTDASINSGNSGGPLVDSYGHVIGVNTATFTRKGSGLSSGVNFAIPIDTVVHLVPYLIVYGTSKSNRY